MPDVAREALAGGDLDEAFDRVAETIAEIRAELEKTPEACA